jgi:hypothetical protein
MMGRWLECFLGFRRRVFRGVMPARGRSAPFPAMHPSSSSLLDAEPIQRAEHLGLQARTIVEGYMAGARCSPFRGFAVEFAHHHEYVPADDTRHLDWKVLGRSDLLHQAVRAEDELRRAPAARWQRVDEIRLRQNHEARLRAHHRGVPRVSHPAPARRRRRGRLRREAARLPAAHARHRISSRSRANWTRRWIRGQRAEV